MHRFIDGEDRMQQALLPHSLEDYVGEENPVRVVEVFIDELDLAALGLWGMTPAATGRPAALSQKCGLEGMARQGRFPPWIQSPTADIASRRRSSSMRSGFISGSH
jgi:hypothetical protein